MEIDPNKLSVDGLSEEVQRYGRYLDKASEEQEAESQIQQQQASTEQQAISEQDDPRNAKKWGAKAFGKELVSIGAGGPIPSAGRTLKLISPFGPLVVC